MTTIFRETKWWDDVQPCEVSQPPPPLSSARPVDTVCLLYLDSKSNENVLFLVVYMFEGCCVTYHHS